MSTQPTPASGRHATGPGPRYSRLGEITHAALLALFLICAGSWLLHLLGLPMAESWRWAEALIPVAATATTLTALSRGLPAQNVMLAAVLIALVGGSVQTLSALTGIPFGACIYTDNAGPRVFDILPWPMPLVWVVVVLNARGVARLILRPWRKTSTYGFRLIGLTCLLAALFDFALEPFASKVSRYWIWQTPETVLAWHTAPWVDFFGWFITTLLILVLVTPCLINKKPVRHPPDYHPLAVWLVLNLIIAAGAAMHDLRWAAGITVFASALITLFAVRGARW
jgi:uncharacterized membrane protein